MDDSLLDRLRTSVGSTNVLMGGGLSAYVIEGHAPGAVIFPGSVEHVSTVMRMAGEARTCVIPWGGGTAVSMGTPPPRPAIVLDMRHFNRLLEHEPGDLTVTVEAGMTMSVLQAVLRARGQWLALDPSDATRASIGGVIGANASGPRRHLYGTMRDLLIGLTVVTAEGTVVRGGGKVVKNVAGYDLPKLFVGSYGTLGVIVDATMKLRPLPQAESFMVVGFSHLSGAGAAAGAVMASDLIPQVLDVLDAETSQTLGVASPWSGPALVVGFDGPPEQTQWQCDELVRVIAPHGPGITRSVPTEQCVAALGRAPRRPTSGESIALMRFSALPKAVTELMERGAATARAHGFASAWRAHAGAGVITGALYSDAQTDVGRSASVLREWRRFAREGGGYATIESAAPAIKSLVPVWDDLGPAARIMQRIKQNFDPEHLLNPGCSLIQS